MLKQLIKLDFLWCNHSFLYIAGADLLSALLTRLSTNWESSLGSFMRHFFSSLTITLFFSLSLNVLARLIINFKNKTFRDESYLFRTLPVKASELWNAKVLSSVLLVLSVSAAILLCLAVSTLTLYARSHLVELVRQVDDLRFFGGVLNYGGPLRECRRQKDVLGSAYARKVEVDDIAFQSIWSGGNSYDLVLIILDDFGAKRPEALEVKVYGSLSYRASARHRHNDLAVSREHRAHSK